jgi:glycosyltransferase involved in cell wall biosynthesis
VDRTQFPTVESHGRGMKLLVIVPSRERGGAEGYALKIATAAVNKWEVHAAIPEDEGTAPWIADFRAQGITCHPFQIPPGHFLAMKEEPQWKNVVFPQDGMVLRALHALERNIRMLKEVARAIVQVIKTIVVLARVKPDVVLLDICWGTFGMGILLGCGLLKQPTAVVFQLYPFPFSFRRSKSNAYRWARTRSQKWIAVSENNRKLISDSFHARSDEILLIYNGVMSNPLGSEPTAGGDGSLRRAVRREMELPETALLILTVGRLERQKGYDYLIPAIAHITREFEDVWFVWVGEGQQRDNLLRQLEDYRVRDRVKVLGRRSDVPRLMKSADLFVFPTRYEGHPFALLEAMAHGLPIVASDASGIPEIVEDRIHGVLSKEGDSCDLLEALRWALKHPRQMHEMAGKAKERVLEFSEDKMVKQTLQVLWKLGNSRKRGN